MFITLLYTHDEDRLINGVKKLSKSVTQTYFYEIKNKDILMKKKRQNVSNKKGLNDDLEFVI